MSKNSFDPKALSDAYQNLRTEMAKIIIGQEDVLEKILLALLCRGHVLLVGPPGMAKTTLVQNFATTLDLPYNRIQFTPDLMPSDILGTEILQENRSTGHKEFKFHPGPIFTQILLADEINRTPPKTQAALLQAMQERQITLFGHTTRLEEPFMVLATQNPIEQEGTYPLPEAQLDRFLFSLNLDYPSETEEIAIMRRHTMPITEWPKPIFSKDSLLHWQSEVLKQSVSDHVYQIAVKAVRATRPTPDNPLDGIRSYVKWGAGPRAAQALLLAAKARSLLQGRPTPLEDDVVALLRPILAHRVQLNFQAEAEGIYADQVLEWVTQFIQA
jgi:MoxR-like ATPase